jgi:transposase
MDNCATHKAAELAELVQAKGKILYLLILFFNSQFFILGCILVFLPAYSPDLNPIEESFSACKSSKTYLINLNLSALSKSIYSPSLSRASVC